MNPYDDQFQPRFIPTHLLAVDGDSFPVTKCDATTDPDDAGRMPLYREDEWNRCEPARFTDDADGTLFDGGVRKATPHLLLTEDEARVVTLCGTSD